MLAKYTVDSFAKKFNLTRQSAINKLAKLKKQGYVNSIKLSELRS